MAASTCKVLQLAQIEVSVFIRSKGIFVSFKNAKYVETRFVKIMEYTHKKKKTVDLRTTPTFLSAIIHENTT